MQPKWTLVKAAAVINTSSTATTYNPLLQPVWRHANPDVTIGRHIPCGYQADPRTVHHHHMTGTTDQRCCATVQQRFPQCPLATEPTEAANLGQVTLPAFFI